MSDETALRNTQETSPPADGEPASAAGASVRLPNGVAGREFNASADLGRWLENGQVLSTADVECLRAAGLTASIDGQTLTVSGIAQTSGEHHIPILRRRDSAGRHLHLDLCWFVNADPQSLWRSIEPDASLGYRKEHTSASRIAAEGLLAIGASTRGRAHAHDGRFREDDYELAVAGEWLIAAVADGAGSAQFSREGSRIACRTVVQNLSTSIVDALGDLTGIVANTEESIGDHARRQLLSRLYQTLGGAAFDAFKAIEQVATGASHALRDYATTLLLAVSREIAGKVFVATFWIGDGAIAVLENDGALARLMGTPDGGEFSGQTRFLTMPEILADAHNIVARIAFTVGSPSAVILCTDGISDPKFGTDKKLRSSEAWSALLQDLQLNVRPHDEGSEERLLEWMNFHSPGEHDDRTIVMICRNGRA